MVNASARVDVQQNSQQFLTKPLAKNFANPTIIALLSGFTISSITFNTAATPLALSIQSKQVSGGTVRVGLMTNFASTVAVGYVVYASIGPLPNLAIVAGETRSTLNVNPIKLIKQLNTSFYGIGEFTSPNRNSLSFEAKIGNNFNLQINSRVGANVLISYLLVENPI